MSDELKNFTVPPSPNQLIRENPVRPTLWSELALKYAGIEPSQALHKLDDPEAKKARLREIKEVRKRGGGPKFKFTEGQVREAIRSQGNAKAGKAGVATALKVKESTLWRWCKRNGFLNWKEACWYFSKY